MHVLLDPARHPVVGHRGNRAHAPEDTVESFTQALALGVDAVEFDLHLSRDGVPVVIHDPTLDRTTDRTGAVAELTLAEIKCADAGFRFTPDGGRTFPYRGRGIRVPTLEEALAATAPHPLLIEMKSVGVARPALAILERTGDARRALVGSFSHDALVPFRAAGIPIAAASRALAWLYLPALLGAHPKALPFESMAVPRFHHGLPVPIRQYARVMRELGRTAHVWTVNSAALARRLWAKGVNGIITDDPALILAARAAGAAGPSGSIA
jgi:glycerophosphoryl diester phosphodiesterase